jgi:hypothetical protein
VTAPARVEVERILPWSLPAVREVVSDVVRYPEWIEPLNWLEPQGDGTYLADVGYFGQPNRHLMRPLEGPEVGLETVGGDSLIRWTVVVAAADGARTAARFVYEKGGSGTVFGASSESPVFLISIEVLSERSLERLERILASGIDQ